MQTTTFSNPSPSHQNQRQYAVNNFMPEVGYEIQRGDLKKNQNIPNREPAGLRQAPPKETVIYASSERFSNIAC